MIRPNFKIKRDVNCTNISSSKIRSLSLNTKNCNIETISAINVTTNITPVVGELTITIGETNTINPNNHRSYVAKFATIDNTSTVAFTLDIDTSQSQIGDLVVVFLQPQIVSGSTIHHINMTLSSKFFYTACGSHVTTLNVSDLERLALPFIYDGEKFVNTYDNC